MPKPRVTPNPTANQYAGPDERIVEYSDPVTGLGGLISIHRDEEAGTLTVDLYRHDADVVIRVSQGEVTR